MTGMFIQRKNEYPVVVDGHCVMMEWDEDFRKMEWAVTRHSPDCKHYEGRACTMTKIAFKKRAMELREELKQMRAIMN